MKKVFLLIVFVAGLFLTSCLDPYSYTYFDNNDRPMLDKEALAEDALYKAFETSALQ